MAYTTRKTLLQGIHDNDEKSWEQFQEFYRPLIRICGHDYKLTDEEIKDLQQEVLIEIFRANVVNNYDKEKGRFRDYLRTIIHRKIFGAIKNRLPTLPEDGAFQEKEESMEIDWSEEWRQFIIETALDELKEQVSETSFLAYDLYVNQGLPPAKVAKMLSITPNQVYSARTRCIQQLKEIVEKLKSDDSM